MAGTPGNEAAVSHHDHSIHTLLLFVNGLDIYNNNNHDFKRAGQIFNIGKAFFSAVS